MDNFRVGLTLVRISHNMLSEKLFTFLSANPKSLKTEISCRFEVVSLGELRSDDELGVFVCNLSIYPCLSPISFDKLSALLIPLWLSDLDLEGRVFDSNAPDCTVVFK